MSESDLVSVRQLADLWNASPSYVRRVLANVDHAALVEPGGTKLYRLADAQAARAARPGRGTRTDLSKPS